MLVLYCYTDYMYMQKVCIPILRETLNEGVTCKIHIEQGVYCTCIYVS